jgi:L,D-peptidoglycan transpeptidase YkuD (ErfK/YbiS/YcfS/YnhG family)
MRTLALLVVLAAVAVAAPARAGTCTPAALAAVPATARQAVAVAGPTTRATTGTLELWSRAGTCWRRVAGPWAARLGFAGLSANRHEGDGSTPLGVFAIGPTAYGVLPDPGARLAYHRLSCGDWWDEDVRSPTYNSFRHVACGTRPAFTGPSEALWQSPTGYALLAVVEFNTSPVVAGRGSGIFVHADIGHSTNGCVSIPLAQMARTLRWLDPAAHPVIAIRIAA